MTDIEIARSVKMKDITEIAKQIGVENYIEAYGKYKAKVDLTALSNQTNSAGKLILVTAITPTPAGEGKTTTTVGLADSLKRIGKNVIVALREPSLGPVFGVKGGAAGGGYAQVVPMEDINLHFTGDFHAIGAANNLLAAMLDNHIQQGNALGIDPRRIAWKRCVDMNDRQLRNVVDGLGGRMNGVPREDGFDITVASEVMAVFCMATSLVDLKNRLSRMIVGYTYDNRPVTAGDLNAEGAMTALLKDALKPNLVQTLEGTPAFVHGGPFANIAHGCNSVLATKMAMNYADYTVTEAGFGSDLGAEKFLNIKCRQADIAPSAVVLVATIRALKLHGGEDGSNIDSVTRGFDNLLRHYCSITLGFRLPCVVAINRFSSDIDEEIQCVLDLCDKYKMCAAVSDVCNRGSEGGIELAQMVVAMCDKNHNTIRHSYSLDESVEDKIMRVVRRVYGGSDVSIDQKAMKKIQQINSTDYGKLPICIAKTQYSLSDNPKLLCAPTGFTVTVRDVKVSAGAGFIVVYTGDIMTMPGLPKRPAAESIDVDEFGNITGLF